MRLDGRFARLLVVITLLALPQFAEAAQPLVVGDGTPGSCTEAALQAAVAVAAGSGGGTIKFKCGGHAVTIILTAPLIVPHNTTIDGGDVVTLSVLPGPPWGISDFVVISIDGGSTVLLKNLTFNHVGTIAAYPLVNEGSVTIQNSTFFNNSLNVINEGALTVVGSTFSHNGFCCEAGSIWNFGALDVKNSLFSHNRCGGGGGIINDAGGTLTVKNTTFADNVCDDPFGSGGGILNSGTARVETSVFSRNSAGQGGGINNFGGTLTVKNTLFDGNGAGVWGGAILNSGFVTLDGIVFSNNHVGGLAGGGFFNAGEATVANSEFLGNNTGWYGGGVFNAGTLSITNSIIARNTAGIDGGGIFTCAIGGFFGFLCAGTTHLTNTVVTGNTPNDIAP